MARIVRFEDRGEADSVPRHTEVDCGYKIARSTDEHLLLLETYGSSQRAIPGKTSQSLLIDEASARELVLILERVFPSLRRQ